MRKALGLQDQSNDVSKFPFRMSELCNYKAIEKKKKDSIFGVKIH